MLLKFRLEMDVIIDQNSETAVIELARQHYRREGEVTAPGRHGRPNRVKAEKFIDGIPLAMLRRRDSSFMSISDTLGSRSVRGCFSRPNAMSGGLSWSTVAWGRCSAMPFVKHFLDSAK